MRQAMRDYDWTHFDKELSELDVRPLPSIIQRARYWVCAMTTISNGSIGSVRLGYNTNGDFTLTWGVDSKHMIVWTIGVTGSPSTEREGDFWETGQVVILCEQTYHNPPPEYLWIFFETKLKRLT